MIGATALLGLVLASPALAFGPGENFLVSGLPGLAAPSPSDYAWNESPTSNDAGVSADISADGRWVAFGSMADGLVTSAEDRRYQQVFVKDRQTGTLIHVTAGANGSSFGSTISDDGTKVAFETQATNLVPNDPTPDADVVVRDLVTGTTTLITDPAADGCPYGCASPELSGDGSRVVFVSPGKLLPADGNDHEDVYSRLSSGGGTVLVSRAGAVAGNGRSLYPSVSDDGKIVAFRSEASNLVAGDNNGKEDIFVRDTVGGQTVLASAASGMSVPGNGHSTDGVLSGDGKYVAFSSQASNLGDGDGDTASDVHRRDVARATTAVGATVLISKTPANVKANQHSQGPQISDDGSKVSFRTSASNVPAGIGRTLLRDVAAGTTVGLGAGPDARALRFSGNGALRLVSDATFVPSLEPGLAVVGPGAVTREIVSRPTSGTPLLPQLTDVGSDVIHGDSHTVSADGRFVVFASGSPALIGASTVAYEAWVKQIYRRDNRTGEVVLVSRGSDGVPSRYGGRVPSISNDGNRVAFLTNDKLTADADSAYTKVYVRDIAQGTTTVASRPSGTGASALSANVDQAQISGDGGHVVFTTNATTLDPVGTFHSYVRDLTANTTVVADRANGAAGAKGNAESTVASISADGTRVAFLSGATNLGDGDTGNRLQVHVRNLAAGTTVLASRATGAAGAPGNAHSWEPEISADGTAVVFETDAQNLDPSAGAWPQGAQRQVVVRNLATATTTLVSRGAGSGAVANDDAQRASIANDGRRVAYDSFATNLGNPAPRASAVFVRDVASGAQRVVAAAERSDPGEYNTGTGTWSPGLSGDGRCVAFAGRGTGIVAGVSPDYLQVFVRVLDGDCGTPTGGSGGDGGGGGAGGGLPSGPGTAPASKPRLSGVRLTRTRFRVGPGRTATSRAKRAKRTAAGTTVRFTLSAPATVSFVVSRPAKGRKVRSSCRKPTRSLRRRPACVRQLPEGTITRKHLKAGAHALKFTGRIGRKGLRTGKHRMRLRAVGSAGSSNAVTLAFTVVRR